MPNPSTDCSVNSIIDPKVNAKVNTKVNTKVDPKVNTKVDTKVESKIHTLSARRLENESPDLENPQEKSECEADTILGSVSQSNNLY